MSTGSHAGDEQEGSLPEPGTRWGSGAQSVLPYLTKTLQARPAAALEQRDGKPGERNPVFANWPPRPGA